MKHINLEQKQVTYVHVDSLKEIITSAKKNTVKYSKDNALEKEDQKELIKAIYRIPKVKDETKYRWEVLIHLMMNAGLRVSEALQVRYEWFSEIDEGIILNIPDKDMDLGNHKRPWNPKTKAGKREVFFIDRAVGEKVRSFFVGRPKGLDMLRQRAYQIVKLLGKEINKPDVHPHALRSTHANNLVYNGCNATTLMYAMGWSDLNVALNYIKASNVAARKDLINKMRDKERGF